MKSHISATIEQELVEALQEIRRHERRSMSNIIEAAVAEYVEKHQGTDQIVTSPGRFAGKFSRRETYARAKR
jgi:metal-responsive CopG/Arc/MetJ family transcriptional regulator